MKRDSMIRGGLTALVIVISVAIGYAFWHASMSVPDTRDGRVRAEVTRVAPDVSGLVTSVNVVDNGFVSPGDVLFKIDPQRYQLAVEKAQADLEATLAATKAADADVNASAAAVNASMTDLHKRVVQADRRRRAGNAVSVEAQTDADAAANTARATLEQAEATHEAAKAKRLQSLASVKQAQNAVHQAELDLDRSVVRSVTTGHVTNLDVRPGNYVTKGTPGLAIVSSDKVWVYGYFEETRLSNIKVGNEVDLRLMNGGVAMRGTVESIARGVSDGDNMTNSGDLLVKVSPTFNWIRLAQRIPVRVRIDPESVPKGVVLASGMTASVKVKTK